jgi:hypothetical protein
MTLTGYLAPVDFEHELRDEWRRPGGESRSIPMGDC